MKILCVSDSHLDNEILANITNRYPDMDYYIHCGDSSLVKEDPLLAKYYVVEGNHDSHCFSNSIILEVANYRCLITHGHLEQVYYGYEKIVEYMKKEKIDICFHGHTHVPTFEKIDGKYIINPGSTMINRASYGFGTYAIITLDEQLKISFFHHITHQECTKQVLEEGKKTLQEFKQILKK